MSLHTTAGRLLIDDALPPEYRGQDRILDGKKGLRDLLQEIATKTPEKYREISKKLLDVGGKVAFHRGGFSFGLQDLRPTPGTLRIRQQLEADIDRIMDSDRSEEDKRTATIKATHAAQAPMEKTIYQEALASNNPLALQVLSGSRGGTPFLKTLIGGDLLYLDHRDRPIPIPVLRSYSEGLTPSQYFAGAFGARKGVVDVKKGVADAGGFAKVLNQVAHRLVVSGSDADPDDMTRHGRGLPVPTDDPDNEGALLAVPAGNYPRNTVLTPKVLHDLQAHKIDHLVVRSPLTSTTPDGGIYARDVGMREHGRLPSRGELVGLAAAQALCLAEGTEVWMADGSVKCIERIKPGEEVVAVGYFGNNKGPVKVLAVHANGERYCERYTYRLALRALDGQWYYQQVAQLLATPEHKVLMDCNEQPNKASAYSAYNLQPLAEWKLGDYAIWLDLHNDNGEQKPAAEAHFECNDNVILWAREPAGRFQTYDLEIDDPDHMFLLANGLVVANSEPISQSGLNSKHVGGVAGAGGGVTGFQAIKQLTEVPETFPGGATHAQRDGRIDRVEEAPAGGHYVYIEDSRHYVPANQELRAKPGDTVEAGDLLSNGIPNPSEIIQHKGIGEGRRYFVNTFRQTLKDAGIYGHRRNIELLARGLINHVRMTDEHDHHIPDDVVPYDLLEHGYRPREDAEQLHVGSGAVGRYLEQPVLHYSIGTPIKPSVVKELKRHGVKDIVAHREPPPFIPEMQRAHDVLLGDPDWLVRMYDSNLKRGLLRSAERGLSSDEAGTSFVPSLAHGINFGQVGILAGDKSKP